MIVTDETILIDFRFIFKAIREEKGNWQKVEAEMEDLFATIKEKTE